MKRLQSGHRKKNATLGDALSTTAKVNLHRLRDTLEKQTQGDIASQLVVPSPPWRGTRKQSASSEKRNSKNDHGTSHEVHDALTRQQIERRMLSVKGILDNQKKNSNTKPSTPRRKTTAFEYWDFPGEASVRELPPESISDVERVDFEEILNLRSVLRSRGRVICGAWT